MRRLVFKDTQYHKNTCICRKKREAETTNPGDAAHHEFARINPRCHATGVTVFVGFKFPGRMDLQEGFMAKMELKAYSIKMIKSVVLSAIVSDRLA